MSKLSFLERLISSSTYNTDIMCHWHQQPVSRQVQDYCKCVSLFRILLHFKYCVFSASARAIAKATICKQRFIDWHLLLRDCLLSRSYLRLLLIRFFTSRLLWPLLTSVRSALLYTEVTPFRAYRTDLPGYHTFVPLHPSVSSIMYDSV